MATVDKIKKLARQLFPTGRAFRMPFRGVANKVLAGLAKSDASAYDDAVSILDTAIPDNDNFTSDDATSWERRYGMISNPAVSLSDRKAAIRRKMNHPGPIKARQNWRFIQKQLQDAGFDLYVFENRFDDGMGGYVTKTPAEFSNIPYPSEDIEYGDDVEYGDAEYGGDFANKVVNSIYQPVDDGFNIGDNYRSTFFIGAENPGDWADVDAEREIELRQLVLRIKPAQTVGYLLINYV